MASILSNRPDAFNYFYGFMKGDHRQINVRLEDMVGWNAYVGGEKVPGHFHSKNEAEQAAISWAKSNPEPVEGDEG
jgi:hypothetical protein